MKVKITLVSGATYSAKAKGDAAKALAKLIAKYASGYDKIATTEVC